MSKCLVLNQLRLRCTLVDFEKNYQAKNLSKQLSKVRFFSHLASNNEETQFLLNPLFITGFSDG